MSALTEFLYPLPAPRRTAVSVIGWWEARRLPFNLIVGAVGCFTVLAITLLTTLPGNFPGPPLAVIIGGSLVYGVLANLCYCLGPLVELTMYRLWGDQAPRAGPVLFRQGLVFSIGLTLFPIVLALLGTGLRVLSWIIG